MLQQRRDANIRTTAQVPQRGTSSVGTSSSAWKGKKSSDIFQAVPNSMGYVEPLEDSPWSQNVDSAASMYAPPTLPLTLDLTWGEDYQDLSGWCSKQQPETAANTEVSSFTAQDVELNTPEVGIQHDFNFTAYCNVLKENSTSQYLSEGWDTSPLLPSPPLYVTQKSSLKEPLKTDADNTRSVTANEFFIDDDYVQSVSHEEEIVTSNNVEALDLEFVQSKESDNMKKSVNLYALGVSDADISMDIGDYRSIGKDNLVGIETEIDTCTDNKMANHVANTDKVVRLGSLLGSDFCVRREGNNDPEHTNQLKAEENFGLKNVLSGNSFLGGSNDEMKSVDETWGCNPVVSKMTDTVLSRKCEIIRPVRPNTYMMMQTVGSEEVAGKAVSVDGRAHAAEFTGRKETSIFGTDVPAQKQQQSLPVNSEVTEPAEHVEVSAKSLAGTSLEPHVAATRADEDVSGGNLGMQPQMAIKEEGAMEKKMKLTLPAVCEGADDSSIGISTPDVFDLLLKHNGNFDLIGYVFSNPKEFQQDLPLNGGDRISVSCTDETAKAEPITEQVNQSPNDAESLDNTVGDAAVKVEVVEPFCIAKLDDEQDDSVFEPIELVEQEAHCSLERRSDQLFEGQTRTDVKNNLKGNKGQQIQKVSETRNGLLESRIVQDGSDLRLTISKVKASTGRTGSKRVALPQQQVPPKEDGSELKELPLSKRVRGRPAKQSLLSTSEVKPSTSEVKHEMHTTNRPTRRKLCSMDEPWVSPSRRMRLSSGESCDRYRELRDKNNEASRKSRQNRKTREHEMKEYAAKLASENQTLKIKADEMERLVKKLRQALLEAVVKTKQH